MKTIFKRSEFETLECYECHKNLTKNPNGHLVIKYEHNDDKTLISDIRVLCKKCDRDFYRKWAWKDIPDLFISDYLIQWILGIILDLHKKTTEFNDKAMEELMRILLLAHQKTSKELTEEQTRRLKILHAIPRILGGLG